MICILYARTIPLKRSERAKCTTSKLAHGRDLLCIAEIIGCIDRISICKTYYVRTVLTADCLTDILRQP